MSNLGSHEEWVIQQTGLSIEQINLITDVNKTDRAILKRSCAMIYEVGLTCPREHLGWRPEWDCCDECDEAINETAAEKCWLAYFEVSDE